MYVYMYMYICVYVYKYCVCVCVCARACVYVGRVDEIRLLLLTTSNIYKAATILVYETLRY